MCSRLEKPDAEWQGSLSFAKRNEPDRRETCYDYEVGSDVWYLSDRPEGNTIFYSYLNDRNLDFSSSVSLPFRLFQSSEDSSVKAGFHLVDRRRNVDTRRFKYFHKGPDSNDAKVQRLPAEDVFVATISDKTDFSLRNIRFPPTTTPEHRESNPHL